VDGVDGKKGDGGGENGKNNNKIKAAGEMEGLINTFTPAEEFGKGVSGRTGQDRES